MQLAQTRRSPLDMYIMFDKPASWEPRSDHSALARSASGRVAAGGPAIRRLGGCGAALERDFVLCGGARAGGLGVKHGRSSLKRRGLAKPAGRARSRCRSSSRVPRHMTRRPGGRVQERGAVGCSPQRHGHAPPRSPLGPASGGNSGVTRRGLAVEQPGAAQAIGEEGRDWALEVGAARGRRSGLAKARHQGERGPWYGVEMSPERLGAALTRFRARGVPVLPIPSNQRGRRGRGRGRPPVRRTSRMTAKCCGEMCNHPLPPTMRNGVGHRWDNTLGAISASLPFR
jgi:hypothetical protein